MITNAEEIKRNADIADIIGRRIPLKPARHGNHLEGSCPFHHSASGKSFHVTPDKNSWWCWGCRVGGNAVKFIMDYERVDYPTALEIIASESRITVQYDNAPHTTGAARPQVARQDIIAVLDKVCSHYEENLRKPQNAKAMEYITGRGFNEETLKKYRIGYAMGASVLTIGIPQDSLVAAGVIKVSETTGNRYDPLEGRIIIPIYDNAKHPVGFTGRLIGKADDRPKYLNTADTAVFKKGRTLFGWYAAHKMLQSVLGTKKIYLIEGQLKAIALCEAGYPAIAAGGTGFTDQQAALISRLSDKAVIVPDPDQAGEAAAISTARTLRKAEIDVEIGELDRSEDPLAKDPDDLWAKGLAIRIDTMTLMRFMYYSITTGRCTTSEQAKRVSRDIVPIIMEHPLPAVRTIEMRELAELSGIPESALATTPAAAISQLPQPQQQNEQPAPIISLDLPPERLLLAVVLQVGPAGNPDWLYSIPVIELPSMVGAVLREIIWTFRYAQINRLSVCDALPPTVDAARLPWYQYWLQADTNGEITTTRALNLAQEIIEETRKAAAMDAARRNMLDLSQTIANWK